ncbi:unnamed protein product [Knipowitschia caucasica]|uniref:Uncharacterized protein n=1 Tax=Knipowitschia caucasica TaxID=637954 RepID=A0AAV2MAK5_KNICA
MSSEAVTDVKGVTDNKEKQTVEEVESLLQASSDRVKLCNTILDDLKLLNEALVRRSLQDVSMSTQK